MTMAEKLSPGMTVDAGAPPAGRSAARRRHRIRRSRCAPVDLRGACDRSHRRLRASPTGRCRTTMRRRCRALDNAPPQSRTGRAHSRPQGILEPAVPAFAGHTGAASGNRDRRRSRARCRCTTAGTTRCGSPISAPDPARSCLRLLHELPNAFGIGTDRSADAIDDRARQCRRSAAFAERAVFAACDYSSALARFLRSCRFKSALYRERRYRSSADRCAETTIRASRSMAARTALPPIARSPPMPADSSRLAGALVVELGFGQLAAVSDVMANAGLAPTGPVQARHCGHSARVDPRGFVMIRTHSGGAKNHLECGTRPTSFRLRNRPEGRRDEARSMAPRGCGGQGESRGPNRTKHVERNRSNELRIADFDRNASPL